MKRLVMIVALAAMGGVAQAEPPDTHEYLERHAVSFWGNTRPSTNGAYRWRLLGIGIGIAGIMGFVMLRLIKKANNTPRPDIEIAPRR